MGAKAWRQRVMAGVAQLVRASACQSKDGGSNPSTGPISRVVRVGSSAVEPPADNREVEGSIPSLRTRLFRGSSAVELADVFPPRRRFDSCSWSQIQAQKSGAVKSFGWVVQVVKASGL